MKSYLWKKKKKHKYAFPFKNKKKLIKKSNDYDIYKPVKANFNKRKH